MQVFPHLDAFQTGQLLVPFMEIKLELFCNNPDFFLFGFNSTAKYHVTLMADDLKVKLYSCHVSLKDSVYNTFKVDSQLA